MSLSASLDGVPDLTRAMQPDVRYEPAFLSEAEADQLYQWLVGPSPLTWGQESFRIFGKTVPAPRQLAWCGAHGLNYRYTGVDHVARGWPPELTALRDRVCEAARLDFNFLLLNRYRSGADHMGWHRDDEHGSNAIIASLSLGSERRFRIRTGPGAPANSLQLAPGSLLVFDGRLQHQLVKTRRPVGERINLTFRRLHAT